jgi:hypothetical protein
MPLDPNLITDAMAHWQAPPMFDPLARYAKLQALQNGVLQQQQARQELQTGALKLQQEQQDIQDQQNFRQVLAQTGGDYAKAMPLLAGKMSPTAQAKFQEVLNKQAQDLATLDKTKLENLKTKNEMVGNALETIATAPPEAQPGLYAQARTDAIAQGYGDPAKLPEQFPGSDWINLHRFLGTSVKDQIDTTLKQKQDTREETKATAELPGIQADAAQKVRVQDATALEAAFNQGGPDAYNAALEALPYGRAKAFAGANTAQDIRNVALTPEQKTTAGQAKATADALATYRANETANRAKQLQIEQQNANINAKKFAMEMGGDAVKGWAKQIADNPDTVSQVPPALRTAVMQQFSTDTGLPFPKALTGTAVDQERASRNALDAVAQVKAALADPEIQKRVGPILGRLGNAEQATGMAIGLSPEQEAKAQQLRTNMRYLVFQEGKALMGGRIPSQLMQQLESSSPNVAMDAGTLNGALAGVSDAANRNMDQTFRQRFGENAVRPGGAAAAAEPDWKAAARNAKVGQVIPLPGGARVLKTGPNSYQQLGPQAATQ